MACRYCMNNLKKQPFTAGAILPAAVEVLPDFNDPYPVDCALFTKVLLGQELKQKTRLRCWEAFLRNPSAYSDMFLRSWISLNDPRFSDPKNLADIFLILTAPNQELRSVYQGILKLYSADGLSCNKDIPLTETVKQKGVIKLLHFFAFADPEGLSIFLRRDNWIRNTGEIYRNAVQALTTELLLTNQKCDDPNFFLLSYYFENLLEDQRLFEDKTRTDLVLDLAILLCRENPAAAKEFLKKFLPTFQKLNGNLVRDEKNLPIIG